MLQFIKTMVLALWGMICGINDHINAKVDAEADGPEGETEAEKEERLWWRANK